MCGRITLTVEPDEIATWLEVDPGRIFEPRYNIAPTQWVPIIRFDPESRRREALPLRWGLVPPWALELSIGNKMINARSESVFEKASFRNAIRKKRCIVPASGFYEWKRGGRERQPFLFRRTNGRPFALAGLWESNAAVPEGPVETFTILTTTANALMEPLHDRMPVILPDSALRRWLDPTEENVRDLLVPLGDGEMSMQPVSSYVNNPAHEGPECIAPPKEPAEQAPTSTAAPAVRRKKSKDAPGQGTLFD
jgi:putative SOS response-associated peptidase YedK